MRSSIFSARYVLIDTIRFFMNGPKWTKKNFPTPSTTCNSLEFRAAGAAASNTRRVNFSGKFPTANMAEGPRRRAIVSGFCASTAWRPSGMAISYSRWHTRRGSAVTQPMLNLNLGNRLLSLALYITLTPRRRQIVAVIVFPNEVSCAAILLSLPECQFRLYRFHSL